MKYTFLGLLIIGLVVSNVVDKSFILDKFMDQPKELFKAYYTLFQKDGEYDINSEEGINRYKIFNDNLKYIKESNAKEGRKIYGITQFTDMTHEEFKRKMLIKPESLQEFMGVKFDLKGPSIPDFTGITITPSDWRGVLGPAKDQGSCGSCWAFAAVGSIEGGYSILSGTQELFSEQYLVDCDTKDGGCNGGWPTRTFEWLAENGARKSVDRPYFATKGICSTIERNSALNIIQGQEYCEGSCKCDFWLKLLAKGPVVVAMDASSKSFSNYRPTANSEEVWTPDSCNQVNHAVLAIGVKVDSQGEVILLVRNSWGVSWGIQGSFWVKAKNHCFIMDFGWRPIIKQNSPFPDNNTSCPLFRKTCDANDVGSRICGGIPNSTSDGSKGLAGWENTPQQKYWEFYAKPNCQGTSAWKYATDKCFATNRFSLPNYVSAANDADYPGECVYFYTDYCKSGERFAVCNNVPDVSKTTLTPSKIKSIFLKGFDHPSHAISVILFKGTNYNGISYGLFRGSSNKFLHSIESNPELADFLANTKSIAIVRG